MDHYLIASDIVRYVTAVGALWVVAMMLRRGWLKYRRDAYAVEGWSVLVLRTSYGCLLLIAVARRFERLGEPGDLWMWATGVAVLLGVVGTLIEMHVKVLPPWLFRSTLRH